MRRIDSVGRVSLPVEVRKAYNITKETDLQILDNGNGIIIYPSNRPYTITQNDMNTLRELYLILKDSGFLDDEASQKLAKITKETDTKCATCGNKMFLTNDNTYKCYNCK